MYWRQNFKAGLRIWAFMPFKNVYITMDGCSDAFNNQNYINLLNQRS